MCGRYNITDDQFTRALLADLGIDLHLANRYNIAPTEQVPVIYQTDAGRQCRAMRWWLVPAWSDGPSSQYAMFNARAESVAKSPAFRGPFRRQRALLPASSFIEWQKRAGGGKQPYELRLHERALAFAGLWEHWRGDDQEIYSCTIITTAATQGFEHIHTRMPLLLSANEYSAWLNPDTPAEAIAALLTPHLPSPLEATPIDPHINNARHKEVPRPTGDSELISQ